MGNTICAYEFLLESLIEQLDVDDFSSCLPSFKELVDIVDDMNSPKKSEKESINEYTEGK